MFNPWMALAILTIIAMVASDNVRDLEVVRALTRSEMQAMFEEAMKTRGGHLAKPKTQESSNLAAIEQAKLSSCKFGIDCESKGNRCKTDDCEKPPGNGITTNYPLSTRRWRGLLITG
ncbi:Hypothetical protein NTJ_00824 [Nesidiocoris tenuis]|uniref:Uncharacterized protein n=1 Tax=Nesidiocoris tenuis TaxID=355587 RepID=A0ABN7A6Y3_9HEMI|nr:Hypothetical protein NTJ_00824 [Nesidiocoris tenuis]